MGLVVSYSLHLQPHPMSTSALCTLPGWLDLSQILAQQMWAASLLSADPGRISSGWGRLGRRSSSDGGTGITQMGEHLLWRPEVLMAGPESLDELESLLLKSTEELEGDLHPLGKRSPWQAVGPGDWVHCEPFLPGEA